MKVVARKRRYREVGARSAWTSPARYVTNAVRMEWLKLWLRGSVISRPLLRALDGVTGGNRAVLFERNREYDRQTVEVMRRVLRRDSNCLDLGAHAGDLLRHIVALCPDGAHHAFEPLPHLAARLRRRFPGVRIHETAVGEARGTAEFQHVRNDPAYSGLRRRLYDRPNPDVVTLPVAVDTLDEAVPAELPVAFLKIDIEGGEYHALKGGARLIARWRPVIVFEAGHASTGQYGVTAADMYALVTSSFGYRLSTMGRWLAGGPAMTATEFAANWAHGPDFYFLATPPP